LTSSSKHRHYSKGSTALTVRRTSGYGTNLIRGRRPAVASSRRSGTSGPPRSRTIIHLCWGVACITCTSTFAHPSAPQPSTEIRSHAANRRCRLAAGTHRAPAHAFPDWYNFRVCLILQRSTVRRLASRRHCHSTATLFPIIDLWMFSTTYVVQIYSGAWTPYSATHHQHPPKATTSFNIIHPYLSKTSFITGHQIL
jgi:hypothetical protein